MRHPHVGVHMVGHTGNGFATQHTAEKHVAFSASPAKELSDRKPWRPSAVHVVTSLYTVHAQETYGLLPEGPSKQTDANGLCHSCNLELCSGVSK